MAKKGEEGSNSDDATKSLEGLTKAFGDMTKQFTELPAQVGAAVTHGINTAVGQQQEQHRANVAAAEAEDDDDDDDGTGGGEGVDLEKLSRAEFANTILKSFSKTLKSTLKPLEASLNTTAETAERDRVAQRFTTVREQNPDFDLWKEEMGELVKTRGYLDPEELIIIAKAKNPEKVKQLADKAAEDEKAGKKQTGEGESGKTSDKPTFLGLMPTSGVTGEEGSPEYKTTKDAAAAAFDDILGGASEEVIGEANVG